MMKVQSWPVAIVIAAAAVTAVTTTMTTNAFAPPMLHQPHVPSSTTRIISTLHTVSLVDDLTETSVSIDDSNQFNWNKAWYPLVPVEILDREQPHRFELLGESIVVWNDGPVTDGLFRSKKSRTRQSKRTMGRWRAFVDECPHRKVPLSEGRVEDDGTLLCSYHAWRFNGEGSCVNIPQMDPTTNEYSRLLNDPKTTCNSYPTKVVDGLLFVWPSSDTNAVLESELTPLPLPISSNDAELDEKPRDTWYGPWNYRELPYSADFFVENVVDPAHVVVSHHNIIGSRYTVSPFTLEPTTKLSKLGFAFSQRASKDIPADGATTFVAPALVTIDVKVNGAKQTLQLYVSPSRPGFCNHSGRMVIVKNEKGEMPAFLRAFTLPMPKWLSHVMASAFLNQDALFLHHQERHLAQTGQYTSAVPDSHVGSKIAAYDYNKAVQAAPSDLGVITFRNWIRVLAGGRIPYRNGKTSVPPASDDMVFDVWNAHTKYCKYCQDALQRLKILRFASYFTAAALAITRPFSTMVGTLISTFTAAGIGLMLSRLISLFYRYEFSHAHND